MAHLARKPLAEIEAELAAGRLPSTPAGIPREAAAHLLVLNALLPSPGLGIDDRVEGEVRRALEVPCYLCGAPTIDYLGTEVLDGSLEWVHVVHTEVRDHFECAPAAGAGRRTSISEAETTTAQPSARGRGLDWAAADRTDASVRQTVKCERTRGCRAETNLASSTRHGARDGLPATPSPEVRHSALLRRDTRSGMRVMTSSRRDSASVTS